MHGGGHEDAKARGETPGHTHGLPYACHERERGHRENKTTTRKMGSTDKL